ncbi:MAG: potassium channel family protein [Verrucomicrobiota bacterium]
MIHLLFILFALVSACVAIHGLGMLMGLRWFRRISLRHGHHFTLPVIFWTLIRVVYGLLLLHLLQVIVWATCYHWNECFPDFATSFYYSATSYSTAGYGDVNPPGNWRILGAIEAVTGILMFGWSTGVLFSVVNHLLGRFKDVSHPVTARM